MLILLALVLWEVASRFSDNQELFPDPVAVLRSFGGMLEDGRLGTATLRTLGRLAQGYVLAILIGIPIGTLIARIQVVRLALKPLLTGLQALPSICWIPLALLWFGLSDAAIIFVVVMGSVLSIAIATEDGIHGIAPLLLAVAGTLGIRGRRLYTGVLLPAALPSIFTGLKLGWSFAWRALMAGELLFVSGGLGQLLTTGRELFDVPQVMAVMVAIILIGVATDRLVFQTLESRIRRRWGLLAAGG